MMIIRVLENNNDNKFSLFLLWLLFDLFQLFVEWCVCCIIQLVNKWWKLFLMDYADANPPTQGPQ